MQVAAADNRALILGSTLSQDQRVSYEREQDKRGKMAAVISPLPNNRLSRAACLRVPLKVFPRYSAAVLPDCVNADNGATARLNA